MPELQINDGKAFVSIINSQFTFTIEVEEPIDIYDMKNVVEDAIFSIMEVWGYLEGDALLAEVTSVYIPSDQYYEVFGWDVSALKKTSQNRPYDFNTTFHIATEHQNFKNALRDLRLSIQQPRDTAMHCFKALESIRHHFGGIWPDVHKALGTDEDELKFITDDSKRSRHAEYKHITAEERAKYMTKTWEVIDKFAKYLNEYDQKTK